LAIFGVVTGLAGALAVTRVLAKMLFGVTATDPHNLCRGLCSAHGNSSGACYVPARRPMRVDPMVALRYE